MMLDITYIYTWIMNTWKIEMQFNACLDFSMHAKLGNANNVPKRRIDSYRERISGTLGMCCITTGRYLRVSSLVSLQHASGCLN